MTGTSLNSHKNNLVKEYTPFHAAYYAHELTRRNASDNIAKLGPSLLGATVDLNPHQLDAALFASRSLLSGGGILADEVGLGKTIEAGLLISQLWAERKRRILVIAPTILRKQWSQELSDKFFLPSQVVDSREFNIRRREGRDPLNIRDSIVICSYHFAAAKQAELALQPWDLVVIDEAHRLRNVYKSGNKIASAIRTAVRRRPLLLLTATPLQNSLLELFGLVSFLDEHLFGDVEAFRERYMRGPMEERQFADLRERLRPICQRTLRRQVTEYVRFTNRIPITQDFTPLPEEQALYDWVSAYLQRETLHALPSGQRMLTTLILRKLLASSTFAIAGTLASLAQRLQQGQGDLDTVLQDEFDAFSEVREEWEDASESLALTPEEATARGLQSEIQELLRYGDLARSITVNAKGEALLQALEQGFLKLAELGASRKAVIFTESRRTQGYLFGLLESNGYGGRVLTINGTNTDDRSGDIYRAWLSQHAGEPVVTGNKTVDLRAALVERFRDGADILIATEAAAEGVNLQFCSLVVNYDLPWNPQRIEQRIGRCHRYGQKHDVVVINFLNRANAADQRVFELLSEKFQLFNGVFGSSDEVLGALESGVDFERRISEIYQSCRTSDEIDTAFSSLQVELDEQIQARMADTRTKLLEHFDAEVRERLRISLEASEAYLDQAQRCFWNLTRFELAGCADFDDETLQFNLHALPPDAPETPLGAYQFVTPSQPRDGQQAYRLGHPLAEQLIVRAKGRGLSEAHIVFHYSDYPQKIGLLDSLSSQSGWLAFSRLSITSLEEEDHLLFAVLDDEGRILVPDCGAKLFQVPGELGGLVSVSSELAAALQAELGVQHAQVLDGIAQRNTSFFDDELEKLERWADDLRHSLEMQMKDLDAQIKAARREAARAGDLQSKLTVQRAIKDLESERSKKRRTLFEAQDEIDARKEDLIAGVEARLAQSVSSEDIFSIRWSVD